MMIVMMMMMMIVRADDQEHCDFTVGTDFCTNTPDEVGRKPARAAWVVETQ